jgi:hypothetical protein
MNDTLAHFQGGNPNTSCLFVLTQNLQAPHEGEKWKPKWNCARDVVTDGPTCLPAEALAKAGKGACP